MKSYEINIICDIHNCNSIETSKQDGLAEAEEQIQRDCEEDGWEIQGDFALCPNCIAKVAKEQNEPRENKRFQND